MAGKKKPAVKRKTGYIDPVYQRFMGQVEKTLKSEEFYRYFQESLKEGKRAYQFSNRKLEKKIDEKWIKAVEDCMDPFNNIIMNPRNFIIEKEEIVNVAVARQSTPEVLRHLTTHGKYIDEITEDNVRPNHLLNKFKEDSWNTYENRFVYTLLEKTTQFVSKRFEAIFANMGEEFGAFLKIDASLKNETDTVATKMDIRIRQNEDYLQDDQDSMSLFQRIARLNERLRQFNSSQFANELRKYARVKNPIVKTNAIRKNPNFKACYDLWVFLYNYHEVGYEINIYEQSSEITPEFEQDIYNSIFFNYLILKNYLDREEDRLIDTSRQFRKRVLKPRYIKKIIEEIVGNYDITDVEIRKVLIEEFTRAQLEQLEEKERRRLVEERERKMAEKRRKEAAEKKKKQQKLQMERAKRLREKEQEKARRLKAEQKRQANIEKLVASCVEELKRFEQEKDLALEKRQKEQEKIEAQKEKAAKREKDREEKAAAKKAEKKAEREAAKAAKEAEKEAEREAVKAAEEAEKIAVEMEAKANEAEVEAVTETETKTEEVENGTVNETVAEVDTVGLAEADHDKMAVDEESVVEASADSVDTETTGVPSADNSDAKASDEQAMEQTAEEVAEIEATEVSGESEPEDLNENIESETIKLEEAVENIVSESESGNDNIASEEEKETAEAESSENAVETADSESSENTEETQPAEDEESENVEEPAETSEEEHQNNGIAGAFRNVWRRIRGE